MQRRYIEVLWIGIVATGTGGTTVHTSCLRQWTPSAEHLEPVSFTYSFYRFNVHRSRRVLPDERQDLQRLAQYIIRNPFAIEKMQVSAPSRANPDGSLIYRSSLNRVPSVRSREVPDRTEGTSSFALTHPGRFSYCLHRKRASSGRSQRARVRAARKAISYQSFPIICAIFNVLN